MNLTIEETNLLAVYSPASRAAAITAIEDSLPYVEEAEMQDIMNSTLHKLSTMNDAVFLTLEIYDEDENIAEMEE